MKLMFHISASPLGIRPSQGFLSRKIAHDDAYAPIHVRTSITTTTGSPSLLIPPCVAADHHAYMRSSSWSVLPAGVAPGRIASSCRYTSVAPPASAIAYRSIAGQRTFASPYPATSPANPIAYTDGMPATQFAPRRET